MHDLPAELTQGPFTVARAVQLGLTPEVLAGRRFRSPWPGVRVLATLPDSRELRCRAAALVLPGDAAFSHETAVELAGWLAPMVGDRRSTAYALRPVDPADPVHVSFPTAHHPHGRGVIGHRFTPARDDVTIVSGLRVTSPWRTLCDLAAAGTGLEDLVILADALRRRFPGVAPVRLAARVDGWGSGRGAVSLRQALASSRDRVDSPMETRLRLMFAEAGLPEPEVNQWVRDADGHPIHQPDLSWPRWKVAADYDGAHHAQRDSDEAVRTGRASNWRQRQDNSRRDVMDDAGWRFRVFTALDVYGRRDLAVERMRRTLRAAGAPL